MTASLSGSLATVRDRLSRAIETSRLVGAARDAVATLARWTGGSLIVRWFLAEPDPAVLVVDLRETYTVGPLLRLGTWTGGNARRLVVGSGLETGASTAAGRFEDAPLRRLGAIVATVALLGSLAGALGGGDVGGWLLLLGAALLATRVRRSASELAESRVGRALLNAVEPPEAPDRDDG